ncbi:hypothetical protein [Actinoplanes sp. DH11]|uniref:hypothetical protein n=1 Tax=Actinoplanes sp. DH11 TaxID=2857011 RepID=UPI001E50A583|nr:hypothetical protein [Actinoplanes sp. DH11]
MTPHPPRPPHLLGGEMPHWSDPAPTGGPALTSLTSFVRGHTLIAGPHDPALIDAVPAERITVLVRGVPDAETLATRYATRPGVEVWCGSVSKLAAVPAFDTVLALDGPERVSSTEDVGLTWEDRFAALVGVLRPGGRLLLGCQNPAGLHRLLALAPDDSDGEWAPPLGDDPTRPAGLAALRERLAAGGLEVLRAYAAFPAPRSPGTLISTAALSDPELHGFLAGVLRRTWPTAVPVLADPQPMGVHLLRSDLATHLAPAWFLLATSTAPPAAVPAALPATAPAALPATAPAALPATAPAAMPAAAPAAAPTVPAAAAPTALPTAAPTAPTAPAAAAPAAPAALLAASADAGGVELPEAVLASASGDVRHLERATTGWLLRPAAPSPSAVTSPPFAVPAGRNLLEILLVAARAHDLPGMRALLAGWQGGEHAGTDADAIVVDGDGRLHAAGPGGDDPAAALRRFADAAPMDLAELIGAMAGVAPAAPQSADRPGIAAFREVAADRDRLARELGEARAQSEWYEQRLSTRDAELTRAYRIISLLKGTVPGRAATAVRGALRTGKRAARTALHQLRKP